MIRSSDALARSLDYHFDNPGLLAAAVTHRSAASDNNERLEFLGDAVLGHVIAEWLYRQFPNASEGQLSRLRAALVKRETLAEIARSLELGEYLQLGSGELKSGGYRRDSILADAFEAVLGSILVDGGFDACKSAIHRLFAERFEKVSAHDGRKDPKTLLQEYLQSRQLDLPTYEMVEISGKAHKQKFRVACRVEALQVSCEGNGGSRRKAEQAAAKQMLEQLGAA